MSTLFSFEVISISGTKLSETLKTENLLVYSDEYNRLKILKYPEIYHLLAFFSPYSVVFKQVIIMYPHTLVALFLDGTIDFVHFDSVEKSIYSATKFAVKDELGDKKVFKICKLDSDRFLTVDEYFVEINILKLEGVKVTEKKKIDLSQEKFIDTSKKFYANRDVEIIRLNGKRYVALIYENEVGDKVDGSEKSAEKAEILSQRFRISDRVEVALIEL